MNRPRHYIRILLLMLLLLAGGGRGAWAVTYHIICLPYHNADLDEFQGSTEIRLDVLQCSGDLNTGEKAGKVYLPDDLRSPLATNYKYWQTATTSGTVMANYPNTYTYTNYTGVSNEITGGTDVGEITDIYVTYETLTGYDTADYPDLTGGTEYTMMLEDRFFCFNGSRNDRPAAITTAGVDDEYLIDDEFNTIGSSYYFLWKFLGEDPYNIVIASAYNGSDTKKHDSRIYARWAGGNKYSMWLKDKTSYHNTDMINESLYTSFALVERNGGFAFMASNLPGIPSGGLYPFLSVNGGRDPMAQLKANPSVSSVTFYKVYPYCYHVLTHGTSTELTGLGKWSAYSLENHPTEEFIDHLIPESIRRKYTAFNQFKADDNTTVITTYKEAFDQDDEQEIIDVYVDYTVSGLPFDLSTNYASARWYTLGMYNNKSNMLQLSGSNFTKVTFSATEEADHGSQFAFIGDPYELKVINRQVCEDNSGELRYVGVASGSADETALTSSGDPSSWTTRTDSTAYVWEIVYDANTGDYSGNMRLREFGTADNATPMYWGWTSTTANYSSTATRVKVSPLTQYTYTYNMVDLTGRIAIKYSVKQDVSTKLQLSTIPSLIVSPFLAYASSLTFYQTATSNGTNDGRTTYNLTNSITETPASNADLYVSYDIPAAGVAALDEATYNVRVNSNYIYYDAGTISHSTAKTDGNAYKWTLQGADPYAMRIYNRASNNYVYFSSTSGTAESLSFGDSQAGAYFIAMSGSGDGIYEVMAATATDIASNNYYCIGRDDTNGVKLYSSSVYPHRNAALRFVLTQTSTTVVYCLIDKQNKKLLSIVDDNSQLGFPAEYQSPLVKEYHYWAKEAIDSTTVAGEYSVVGGSSELTSLAELIYVTYDVSNAINLSGASGVTMYRLKFHNGEEFYQEDGADGVMTTKWKAAYPYANGEANLYIYGNDRLEVHMGAASTTRNRWPWFLESTSGEPDPYHVMVGSASTTYNLTTVSGDTGGIGGTDDSHPDADKSLRLYLHTYSVDYNTGGTHIVTGAITKHTKVVSDTPTLTPSEYMILGTTGNYKLVTTEPVSGERRTVDSFEQYWKNNPTVKQTLIAGEQGTVMADSEITSAMRTYLLNNYEWHSYNAWANVGTGSPKNSQTQWASTSNKRYKYGEHWFQTISMGETFDLEPMDIEPVLVLLDQHGWEIMRKAIPQKPASSYPVEQQAAEQAKIDLLYNAIRPYNSPMVKAYHFWSTGSKIPGYHKYTVSVPITVNGGEYEYTSTDLTKLPPYATSDNITDAKGNMMDQYVTYDVKDEYALSYTGAATEGATSASTFLVQQGTHYAKAADASTLTSLDADIAAGDLSNLIVTRDGLMDADVLWYVKPNFNIDAEMGYKYQGETGAQANALTKYETEKDYYDNGQNGFDPYNIQLQSKAYDTYFTVPHIVSAKLGSTSSMEATYDGEKTVTLTNLSTTVNGSGHDNVTLKMTNGTFMAVQDANGNMRLMPRFDHSNRVANLTGLATPDAAAPKNDKGTGSGQTTILLRPLVYQYIIVDNQGRESLRYKKGGDNYPAVPTHFQSPFAKDFKFYKDLVLTGTTYDMANLDEKEITGAFASDGLTSRTNNVYVRYDYNDTYDYDKMLQGKWLTMQLKETDVQYADDTGIVTGVIPTTLNSTTKEWEWKLLKSPWLEPDPYAVQLLNRNQKDLPMTTAALDGGTVTATADGTASTYQRYAILNHSEGEYALAVAGVGDGTGYYCTDYYFLNGNDMTTSVAAKTIKETGFCSENGTFSGTGSQIILTDEVDHEYTYKVVTNSGNFAVSDVQSQGVAMGNDYAATLPTSVTSPLLEAEDYLYYEEATGTDGTGYTVDTNTPTTTLLGLYDDVIYVRYAYNKSGHNYTVPNLRNDVGSGSDNIDVAGTSKPSRFNISDEVVYNFFWRPDAIMYRSDDAITSANDQPLNSATDYLWKFKGDDPYEIKIHNVGADKYLQSTTTPSSSLVAEGDATTFMLLDGDPKVFAQTGTVANKLTGPTGTLTTETPAQFFIFALPTKNVFYQLVIQKKGETAVNIPYRTEVSGSLLSKDIAGTTLRDLTGYVLAYSSDDAYHKDAGQVALGATLEVPEELKRQFCNYTFYIANIKKVTSEDPLTTADDDDLNAKYKGMNLETLWSDYDLFNKMVYVNVVYTPDESTFSYATDGSTTNWYTLETSDETPYLANYTYQRTTLAAAEGRDGHYTNDYLWAVEGDPYGFYLHNRYATKNGNGWTERVSTATTPAANGTLTLNTTADNYRIFEMQEGTTDGYFALHPVADTGGTLYVNNDAGTMALAATATDWTLDLNAEQLQPYIDRSGYVGALNADGVTAYNAAATLAGKQAVVYNSANTVALSQDYYRIHDATASPYYISGYTHDVERSGGINLHYHEQAETTSEATYGNLTSGTYDVTNGTQGDIPLEAAIYDPSSVFYFTPSSTTTTIATQGLYVNTADDATSMTTTPENLTFMDIGGGVVMLRNGAITTGYLAPHSTKTKTIAKGTDNELTDGAKWCLQPVGTGTHELPLRLKTHSGGDNNYYATLYVPFDVLLSSTNDVAYSCKTWNDELLHLKSVGRYNTEANSCPEDYRGRNQFIPGGTPVIVRTSSNVGYVTMTLYTATPSATTAAAIASTNIFTGQYLEQLLSPGAGSIIYTLGNPLSGLTLNTSDGSFTGTAVANDSGMGFYQNANYNKEVNADDAYWERNNWYVLHNKIYYAQTASPAREMGQGVDFIPVVFDDEDDGTIEDNLKSRMMQADGRVYDLQGRCVATEEMVKDGTWRDSLLPGVYILNGRKVMVK